MTLTSCPICGGSELTAFFERDRLPALCNALWPDVATAEAAAVGDVRLELCGTCGNVVNTNFDPAVFGYSPAYENSLHFSPTFQAFADSVAERLVDSYDIRGDRIVEIGPGSGDFLAQLCRLGDNRGIGFDPSHDPDRAPADLDERVSIEARPFPIDGSFPADLLCARHVLEHVPEPAPLVRAVTASLRAADGVAYFEVPDGQYLLDQVALWDVIYEHCHHFTPAGMAHLVNGAGLDVVEAGSAFGDQFLWIEARPAAEPGDPGLTDEALDAIRAATERFDAEAAALLARADDVVRSALARGPLALWGAGSKGVSFLNMVDAAVEIAAVVDVNPHKDGLHVPVTGQEVIGPDRLVAHDPAGVLVLNANYVAEIGAQLTELGLSADVLTL